MSRRLKYYYMYIENYLQLAEIRGKSKKIFSLSYKEPVQNHFQQTLGICIYMNDYYGLVQ